jgi:hypothetical protein
VELEMSIGRESQDPITAGTDRITCGDTAAAGGPIVTADIVAFGQAEYDEHFP